MYYFNEWVLNMYSVPVSVIGVRAAEIIMLLPATQTDSAARKKTTDRGSKMSVSQVLSLSTKKM